MTLAIGVDVGGTFTDLVALHAGELTLRKVPTEHPPDRGVLQGLEALAAQAGFDLDEVDRLVHGTTAATNALLEGRWAKTALITTRGFRDVLAIGRQNRPRLYDWRVGRPAPMAPRERRYDLTERVDAQGNVLQSLDERELAKLISELCDVDAVAVCFLFSYLNPTHEQQVRNRLEDELSMPVVISSDVLPEYREYERTSTTVVSAALRPIVGTYLERLSSQLEADGVRAPLTIMQSNGGLAESSVAARHPERLLLSGPAGGVAGAQYIGTLAGFSHVITLDMGGTSCDVALIENGRPQQRTETRVGGYEVRAPMVDVHTVGAGGGSVAWIDAGKALRVGPHSAGADPGPAAFGTGDEPTVTDAHLVLGGFDPERPLGGRGLDLERARRAIETGVAHPLTMSVEEAALGILKIADAHMERAIRVVTVERGHDPRDFALLAFGGAGPLHAPSLAASLGVGTVLVPTAAGVLSALGMLATDERQDRAQSMVQPSDQVDPREVRQRFDRLQADAERELQAARIEHQRSVEMRYQGQAYSLELDLPAVTEQAIRDVSARFHRTHRGRYGYAMDDHPTEWVTLRLTSIATRQRPTLAESSASASAAEPQKRGVHFAGHGRCDADVWERADLARNRKMGGPAVIEGPESTIVVPPHWRGRTDRWGNVILETG